MLTAGSNNKIDDLTRESLFGGKGNSLHRMTHQGYNIPKFFVVTNKVFDEWLLGIKRGNTKVLNLLNSIDKSNSELESITISLQKLLLNEKIPYILEKVILKQAKSVFNSGESVAVRSSANIEDSRSAVFAGIFKTFLNLSIEAEIINKVKECFISVFTFRALSYMRQKDIDWKDVKMSVVIQKMIPSDSSGVMLTADTNNRRQYETIIESTWGIGEAIVQGIIQPDEFRVNKNKLTITNSSINFKENLFICKTDEEGLDFVKIPKKQASKPAITDQQAIKLTKTGICLERYFGYFQDIEWAIHNHEIFILQSRPLAGSLIFKN